MSISLALLDFNAERRDTNRGTPAIKKRAKELGYVQVDHFDIRRDIAIPDLHQYRAFVATGGPGDPNDWGNWGDPVVDFFDRIMTHNKNHPEDPKYLFLICHSFQMACLRWQLGHAIKRQKPDGSDDRLIGIHEQSVLDYAAETPNPMLQQLKEPMYTWESRDYRIVPHYDTVIHHPDFAIITARPDNHDNLALTGICSRDGYIIGTQYHVEATVEEAREILTDQQQERNRLAQDAIRQSHGEDALKIMIENIDSLQVAEDIFTDFLIRARDDMRFRMAA